jgi:hypothetical protein
LGWSLQNGSVALRLTAKALCCGHKQATHKAAFGHSIKLMLPVRAAVHTPKKNITMKDFYTLKRFSRVLNDNIKHYKDVLSSGRITCQNKQKEIKGLIHILKWSKKWVDNIRKNESNVEKEIKKNNETL